MKKRILVVVLCLACVASYAQKKKKRPVKKPAQTAQQPTSLNNNGGVKPLTDTTKKAAVPSKPFERPLDGYYKKTNILSAKVTPYPNLRESDVAFAKRVWREIDTREKMNRYLASPKQRLIDVLMTAIGNGELTAYDANPTPTEPGGDGFSRPLTPDAAKGKLADSTLVEKRDANNNVISSKMVAGEFNPDSLVKFRVKEDWVFDKQRSIFEPRIIGLAPMIKIKGAGGAADDYQPAFWIYFPDARPILATKETVSRDNDNTGLSFDDVFMKRIFTSYIVKESNDKDERIKDYATGIDKLYESERIKKNLQDWELNLWQY
ncbi:MAG TPA: gliding motility protein GldN [Mucilaginibacter sp.]|jgi:gliding motility associated protien GldN